MQEKSEHYQDQQQLFSTKKFGLAKFKQSLTCQEAKEVIKAYHKYWKQQSFHCEVWTVYRYSEWSTIFKNMTEAQCQTLNFLYKEKTQKQVYDTFLHSKISFSCLKQLCIIWPQIKSFQVLTELNAPALQKIYIADCRNAISVKSLIKLPTQKLRLVSIGNVGCTRYDMLSRLKLNQERSSLINVSINQKPIYNLKYLFKLQLDSKNCENKRYKIIKKSLVNSARSVLNLCDRGYENSYFMNRFVKQEINFYFRRYGSKEILEGEDIEHYMTNQFSQSSEDEAEDEGGHEVQ